MTKKHREIFPYSIFFDDVFLFEIIQKRLKKENNLYLLLFK